MPLPPDPVSERIVQYMLARFATITIANGFSMDVHVCRLDPLDGMPKGVPNKPGYIVLEEEFPTEAFDTAPGHLDGYRMRVNAHCVVRNNADVTNKTWGNVLHRIAAHARAVIAQDFHLGGFALNTTLGDLTSPTDRPLGALPCLTVPFDVVFWTKRNDPLTAYKDMT